MNETLQAILTRRSCKKYTPELPPDALIEQVIEAGLFAASGMGKQSPIILAVTEKTTRDTLSRLNAKYLGKNGADPFYDAPVVLAVLADAAVPTAVYDGSLVIGNMLLAAHALGLGSCWIHRAKEVFADAEGKALLKTLGIEGAYTGIGHCVLGYSAMDQTRVPPRRENRVYRILGHQ